MYCCRVSCIQYTSSDEEGEQIAGATRFGFGPDVESRERTTRTSPSCFPGIRPNRASVFSLKKFAMGRLQYQCCKTSSGCLTSLGSPCVRCLLLWYGVGVDRLDMDRLSTVRCSLVRLVLLRWPHRGPQPTAGHSRSPCSTGGTNPRIR